VSPDPRIEAAARLMAAHGLAAVEVAAEGPEGEIAALRPASPADRARLLALPDAALVEPMKAIGFRYVAVDLG
jgi:hypothetical protein